MPSQCPQATHRNGNICTIDGLHKTEIKLGSLAEKNVTEEGCDKSLEILGPMLPDSSLLLAYSLDACHQIPLSSDLSHLVAEVQALRGQLEQSIQGNNCLRLQLQQQLDSGAGKASLSPSSINQNFPASADPGNKQLLQGRKEKELRKPVGRSPGCLWWKVQSASSMLLRVRLKSEMLSSSSLSKSVVCTSDQAPDSEFTTYGLFEVTEV